MEFNESAYLQTLLKLLLLFVDYAQSEVNLVGLFKVWLHSHDLRKGFLGVLKRAVPVI